MLLSVTNLIKLYPLFFIGGVARRLNLLLGVDIPRDVKIGNGVSFPHNSVGTVIHPNTVLEDHVKIYQNVTLGRSDVYKKKKDANPSFDGFYIEAGACICAGAKIVCKEGKLRIGKNAVIAANAVVLNSVGSGEIWAGIPAKLIGYRDDI